MASGFEDPEGDPGALSVHLNDLSSRSRTLSTGARALRTGFDHALETWKAPRASDFRSAGEGIELWAAGAQVSLDGAVDALGTYREQLRHAKDRVEDLRHQAAQARRTGADSTSDLPPDDPDAIRQRAVTQGHVERLREEADGVHRALAGHAKRAGAAVDALVSTTVPGAELLSPDQVRRRVSDLAGAGSAGSSLVAGQLSAEQAWSALGKAQDAAPPADWRAWAKAHGLAVPEHLDPQRALALRAQLDQVLADGPTDPALRADLVKRFASRLSPEDLTSLAALDPSRVGNLDGMPNAVRYFSNSINVSNGLESEQQRLDDWQPPPSTEDDSYTDWVRLKGRISMMRSLLDGSPIKSAKGPHQVLAFEPPTYGADNHPLDDGRLAVAIGDLDTADHVGVVVPGITNRIDNFGATLDKAALSRQQAGADSTATVAWLGYDTPEFADSVTTDKAEVGGQALHGFMAGLQRADSSDLTILAHSYGTLVTSKALQLGTADDPLPDRVVLFGSPGLGENVRTLSDLHLPDDYPIYAMRAPGDPVAITAAHGLDPVDIPGITRLDTDWDGPEDVTGHSQYTTNGSDSLFNIGRVLAGDTEHLVVGGNDLADDGFAGPYNANIRALVDRLQEQVPADVQSAFVSGLEADLQRRLTADDLPGYSDLGDVTELTALLRSSAADAHLGDYLSQDEFEQALIDAGFTETTGDLAGDQVKGFLDGLDFADDWSIPVPHTPFSLSVPDGLNEAAGTVFGQGTSFLTEHLSNLAVQHLPGVEKVLGFVDTVAEGVEGARDAIGALEELPGVIDLGLDAVGEVGQDRLDDVEDFAQDRLDDVEDFGEDAKDFGEDAVDTAKSIIPGI